MCASTERPAEPGRKQFPHPFPGALNRWTLQLLHSSLVLRTTASILGLALLLGTVLTWYSWHHLKGYEERQAEKRLRDLVTTIESTAQIACFLKDRSLAREIVRGLMSNDGVAGARVTAGGTTLADAGRAIPVHARIPASWIVTRPMLSPFPPSEPVGEVAIYVAQDEVKAAAAARARGIVLIVALQALLVGGGVAIAVYVFVTQPIRRVSRELHTAHVRSGAHLSTPARNEFDEIGLLVHDVNTLISDLTGLIDTEHELRTEQEASERRMRLIFEKSATGIFMLSSDGRIQSCNPAFAELLKLPPPAAASACGTTLNALLPAHRKMIAELIERSLGAGTPTDADIKLSAENASPQSWIEITLNPVGPGLLQGVVNDISDRKRDEFEARDLASHDSLTGLLNRHGLVASVASAFAQLHPGPRNLAFMQIDLDYFKQVNDTLGHEAGDEVLRHVARVLEYNTRQGDLVGRPGGDEFVIVLVGISAPEKAEEIAARIISDISKPICLHGGHTAQIGASIGIAFATRDDDTPEAIMRRADTAMYEAKKAGRGQVRLAPRMSDIAA